jgi:hypothetical protein
MKVWVNSAMAKIPAASCVIVSICLLGSRAQHANANRIKRYRMIPGFEKGIHVS